MIPASLGAAEYRLPKGRKSSERRLSITVRIFEKGQGWNSGNYAV